VRRPGPAARPSGRSGGPSPWAPRPRPCRPRRCARRSPCGTPRPTTMAGAVTPPFRPSGPPGTPDGSARHRAVTPPAADHAAAFRRSRYGTARVAAHRLPCPHPLGEGATLPTSPTTVRRPPRSHAVAWVARSRCGDPQARHARMPGTVVRPSTVPCWHPRGRPRRGMPQTVATPYAVHRRLPAHHPAAGHGVSRRPPPDVWNASPSAPTAGRPRHGHHGPAVPAPAASPTEAVERSRGARRARPERRPGRVPKFALCTLRRPM